MSQSSTPGEQIEQQMRQVRAELREDVNSLVAGARDLTDWTTYVRRYPWICLGAAAAIGYLIVPRSKAVQPDAATLQELLKGEKLVVKMVPQQQGPSLKSMVVGMATTALLNGGLAILSKQIEQFVAGIQQNPPRQPSVPRGDTP